MTARKFCPGSDGHGHWNFDCVFSTTRILEKLTLHLQCRDIDDATKLGSPGRLFVSVLSIQIPDQADTVAVHKSPNETMTQGF